MVKCNRRNLTTNRIFIDDITHSTFMYVIVPLADDVYHVNIYADEGVQNKAELFYIIQESVDVVISSYG